MYRRPAALDRHLAPKPGLGLERHPHRHPLVPHPKIHGEKKATPDLPPGPARPPLLRSEPALGGPGRPAPRAIHDGLQGRT